MSFHRVTRYWQFIKDTVNSKFATSLAARYPNMLTFIVIVTIVL